MVVLVTEVFTMRSMLRSLVLAPALLAAAAAFAANTTAVNIPYDFVAQGKAFPAGQYDVSRDINSNFLTIRKHGTPEVNFTVTAGAGGEFDNKVSLKFDSVGDSHVLNTVRYGHLVTAHLDSDKKHGEIDHSSMAVGR
jgi:hypothetical protein